MQQRRPPLCLPTNVMVVVAAHTPCRGGEGALSTKVTSSARPAPNRVPHRVPKPADDSFRHVSRFEPHGLLIPVRCPSVGVLLLVLFTLLLSRRIAQE